MDITQIASALKPLKVPLESLYLDIENPRFVGNKKFIIAPGSDPLDMKLQEKIRKTIFEEFGINDLMDSIEQVGFLQMDRMVVRKHIEERYIVVEGNRRLAALKTLKAAEDKKEINLLDHIRDSIEHIEVLLLDLPDGNYKEITWFLQGIRHISGIKDWGPYQQAELVNTLMNEQNMNFEKAGKAVGAGRKKAGQMLRAYKGLKQMEQDQIYGDKASAELFSHFEQAWVKNPLRMWLDWNEEEVLYKNFNNLQLFYQWITEGIPEKNQKPITAQEVRDKLSKIIDCEDAKKKFIGGEVNLDMAYGMALFEDEGYKNWHASVRGAIEHIENIPWTYKLTEEDMKIMESLVKIATEFLKNKAQ